MQFTYSVYTVNINESTVYLYYLPPAGVQGCTLNKENKTSVLSLLKDMALEPWYATILLMQKYLILAVIKGERSWKFLPLFSCLCTSIGKYSQEAANGFYWNFLNSLKCTSITDQLFWCELDWKWPPQLNVLTKHKKGYFFAKFTDNELKLANNTYFIYCLFFSIHPVYVTEKRLNIMKGNYFFKIIAYVLVCS